MRRRLGLPVALVAIAVLCLSVCATAAVLAAKGFGTGRLTADTTSRLSADYSADPFGARLQPLDASIVAASSQDENALSQAGTDRAVRLQPVILAAPSATPPPPAESLAPSSTATQTALAPAVASTTPPNGTPVPQPTATPALVLPATVTPSAAAIATPVLPSTPPPIDTPMPAVTPAPTDTPVAPATPQPQPTPVAPSPTAVVPPTPFMPTPFVPPTSFVPRTPFSLALPTPTPIPPALLLPPTPTPLPFMPPPPTPTPTPGATLTPTAAPSSPTPAVVPPTATTAPSTTPAATPAPGTPTPTATPTPSVSTPTPTPMPPTPTSTATPRPTSTPTPVPTIVGSQVWLHQNGSMSTGHLGRGSLSLQHGTMLILRDPVQVTAASGAGPWTLLLVLGSKPIKPAALNVTVWSQNGGCTAPAAVPAGQVYAVGSVTVPPAGLLSQGTRLTVPGNGAPVRSLAGGEKLCLSLTAAGSSTDNDIDIATDTPAILGIVGQDAYLSGPFNGG